MYIMLHPFIFIMEVGGINRLCFFEIKFMKLSWCSFPCIFSIGLFCKVDSRELSMNTGLTSERIVELSTR